jgi:hypothetical protein
MSGYRWFIEAISTVPSLHGIRAYSLIRCYLNFGTESLSLNNLMVVVWYLSVDLKVKRLYVGEFQRQLGTPAL